MTLPAALLLIMPNLSVPGNALVVSNFYKVL